MKSDPTRANLAGKGEGSSSLRLRPTVSLLRGIAMLLVCSRTRSTVALAAAITAVRATAVLWRGLIYLLNRLALRCWRLLPPSRRATVAMPHRTKGWPARVTTAPRHGLIYL